MPDHAVTDRSLDRAALAPSLAGIIGRLRSQRLVDALTAAVCCLLGAVVVYQLALALIAPPVSAAVVTAVLFAVVVAACIGIARRTLRPIGAAEVAALADTAAGLKDELKSAVWFVETDSSSERDPPTGHDPVRGHDAGRGSDRSAQRRIERQMVALLLQRAQASAERLDARSVVPPRMPAAVRLAALLAAAAVALAAWSPRALLVADGADHDDQATRAATASGPSAEGSAGIDGAARGSAAVAARATGRDGIPPGTSPSTPERTARLEADSSSPAGDDAHRAATGRDGSRGAAAAQETKPLARPETSRPPAAQSPGEMSFAQVARPARTRSGKADNDTPAEDSADGDSFRAQVERQGLDGDKSAENNLQRAMEAAAQRAAEQGTEPPQTKAGNPANTSPAGPRPEGRDDGGARINGQNEGSNPGGNSEVAEGGGQHVALAAGADGRTTADVAQSRSLSDIAAAPVEGPMTARLEAQLQRVRVEGQPAASGGGEKSEEQLYAATRAQRSRLDYRSAATAPLAAPETATTGERVPLAHRSVVRDYFLNLRREEP